MLAVPLAEAAISTAALGPALLESLAVMLPVPRRKLLLIWILCRPILPACPSRRPGYAVSAGRCCCCRLLCMLGLQHPPAQIILCPFEPHIAAAESIDLLEEVRGH